MKRRFTIAILLLLAAHSMFGAVTMTLILRNPMPARLDVWEQDPSTIQLIIQTDPNGLFQNGHIEFTIHDLNTNALVASSKANDPSIPVFSMNPAATVTKFGRDVVVASAVFIDPKYKNAAAATNSIPEGDYEFCVKLVSSQGTEITTTGLKCRNFTVIVPDPPVLTSPMDKAVSLSVVPPTFMWTPVTVPGGASVSYKLLIAPIYKGQTPKNAIDANQPLVQITWSAPTYFYAPANPAFTLYPSAVGFAWQVQAVDAQGKAAAKNDGKSEVSSFTIDSSKAPPPAPQQAQSSGDCNDPCVTSLPSDQAPGGSFNAGDVLKVGLFAMTLTQASGSGAALTGAGTISVPFLKAPVLVAFKNIKVNAGKQVFDGDVFALQMQGSPIPQNLANDFGNALGMSNSDITTYYGYASQGSRLVSAFVSSTPTGLPIGIDQEIAGERFVLAVIGIVFQPTSAKLNAITSYDMPDLGAGMAIGLGARNICFTPGGISSSQGVLYLAADIGFDKPGSFGFRFKAPSLPADSGTYFAWDCNGFRELRIAADVSMPRDWMVPNPDNGVDQVKAHLKAVVMKKGDWIAAATLDKAMLAGANGFVLNVQEMSYDHSDVRNPDGIVFPASYVGTKGVDWHGFFIRKASLTLPPSLATHNGGPPMVEVDNFLIDGTGITADFLAANLLQFPKGDFAGWGASIDNLELHLVSSSLSRGSLNGRLMLPICTEASPLQYSALLSHPAGPTGKLAFDFNIVPTADMKSDLWAATFTLDKSSHISLTDNAGTFSGEALLNGSLLISGDVGDALKKIPIVHLEGIRFQNFGLLSKAPYATPGSWSLISPQHSISGFPISIDHIGPAVGGDAGGLKLGLNAAVVFILMEGNPGLAGKTTFTVWSKMPFSDFPKKFAFDDVELDRIDVNSDIGAVSIDGSIAFYHDHPTYGNGFRGAVSATFAKMFSAKATAQFGSVNGTNYWYVDGMFVTDLGIPFGNSGLGLFGFGGGAYYHMTRSSGQPDLGKAQKFSGDGANAPADDSNDPGRPSNSGVVYVPDAKTMMGFKAGVTIGTYPSPAAFCADVSFSMEILSSGGIGKIGFDGDAYMIGPGASERKAALFLANATITYDFPNKIFDGNFSYWTSDPLKPIVDVHGFINFHFDPQNWHILIGTPQNPNSATFYSLMKSTAYFMAGTDIPSPDFNNFPMKKDIEAAIGSPLPNTRLPFSDGPTEGLAFGLTSSYDTGDQHFAFFYGRVGVGFGCDIALTHDLTRVCDNTGKPPGVAGWYAIGQLYGYALAKGGIDIDPFGKVDLIDVGAGLRCLVMAPNPIYAEGTFGAHVRALGGLIQGNVQFTFTFGELCQVRSESPLAKVDLITDMTPGNGDKKVSVLSVPTAALLFAADSPLDFGSVDAKGNPYTRTFRIEVESFAVVDATKNIPVDGTWVLQDDNFDVKFGLRSDPLPGNSNVAATLTVYAQEFKNGSWVTALKQDGSPIRQTKSVMFSTGPRPDSILKSMVYDSWPLDGQKNVLLGEDRTGRLQGKFRYLFQEPGSYFVRMMPLDGGNSFEIPCSFDQGRNGIVFALPALAKGERYAFQVVRRTDAALIKSSSLIKPISSTVISSPLLNTQGVKSAVAAASTGGAASFGGQTTPGLAFLTRSLPGTEIKSNEKLLYVYYYRTSKFNTLAEKVQQLSFKKTDYTKYWSTHELLVGNYSTEEDFDDYEMYNYTTSDINTGVPLAHIPLIVVTAHGPEEKWFTQFAWPRVYSHIQAMKFARLWPEDLEDKFFLLLGMVNFETTALFQNKSGGKLHVSAFPLMNIGMGGIGKAIGFNSGPVDIQVKYLHGTTVPGDFLTLWFKSHMIMLGYSRGDCDDDGTQLYGKADWVEQNSDWLQYFTSLDINGAAKAYVPMYQGAYKINFIYGPKFSWAQSGPWIKKDLWYGQSPMQSVVSTVVKQASVSSFLSAKTTINSPVSLFTKSVKVIH